MALLFGAQIQRLNHHPTPSSYLFSPILDAMPIVIVILMYLPCSILDFVLTCQNYLYI